MPLKPKTTNPKTNPPETRPSFQWAFHVSPQACKQLTTRAKTDNAFRLTRHQVLRSTDAMNINSVGCIQLYFRLDWACGRTCKVEKGLGPLHRPAFPRGNKSSCGRPGACQSKAIWINGKKLNSVWCEPAGKPIEMLQRCLNFARQELPLCGTCNYQPCAQQEEIMARMKLVPNACFKLYAFKALMGMLWTWAKIPT